MSKKNHNVSAEGRAKLSTAMKARWAANRDLMMAGAKKGRDKALKSRAKPPEPGTEDWRVFHKIARHSNAATAHAYLSRVRP